MSNSLRKREIHPTNQVTHVIKIYKVNRFKPSRETEVTANDCNSSAETFDFGKVCVELGQNCVGNVKNSLQA